MGGSGWLSPPATTTGTPAPSLRHLRRRPSPLGPPTSPTSIPPLVITEIALTSTRRAETSSRRGLMDAGEHMQWRSGRERGLLHQQQYRVQGGVLRTSCQVQIHNQRHVR